jgi:uncharacterized protein DUF2752
MPVSRLAPFPAVVRPGPRRGKGPSASGPWWVAAVLALAVLADVAVDPTQTHVPLCPLHAMTGLDCPLCGSLRAVDELVRGHVATALRDNVLLVAAVPVVIGLWLSWVARSDRDAQPRRWPPVVKIGVIVVVVGFGIARNLPFASALRP